MENIKCLIIGSGPAGYTAATYTGRAGIQTVLYEGMEPGGQLTTTTMVENYPGFENGVDANMLMASMKAQAARFGAEIRSGRIVSADLSSRPFKLVDDNGRELVAETLIIATGATAKYLGLPSEQKFKGLGVSACATCDGFFYRKKVVAVVGGGDTACEEALYLSNLASKVFMIVRKDYLRASKVMQQRVLDNPKIEVLFNTVTKGLFGEEVLRGATVVTTNPTSGVADTYNIDIDGFFLGIGHKPNTAFLRGQIELDDAGYIVTMPGSTATNVEGVYAAGDVADPTYKQAISAAGMGCRAALDAERYITLHQEA